MEARVNGGWSIVGFWVLYWHVGMHLDLRWMQSMRRSVSLRGNTLWPWVSYKRIVLHASIKKIIRFAYEWWLVWLDTHIMCSSSKQDAGQMPSNPYTKNPHTPQIYPVWTASSNVAQHLATASNRRTRFLSLSMYVATSGHDFLSRKCQYSAKIQLIFGWQKYAVTMSRRLAAAVEKPPGAKECQKWRTWLQREDGSIRDGARMRRWLGEGLTNDYGVYISWQRVALYIIELRIGGAGAKEPIVLDLNTWLVCTRECSTTSQKVKDQSEEIKIELEWW